VTGIERQFEEIAIMCKECDKWKPPVLVGTPCDCDNLSNSAPKPGSVCETKYKKKRWNIDLIIHNIKKKIKFG